MLHDPYRIVVVNDSKETRGCFSYAHMGLPRRGYVTRGRKRNRNPG